MLIGAHVSAAGGVHKAVHNAMAMGATAFALDIKNKRRWVSKPLKQDHINSFKQLCIENGFKPNHILPHGSYLINLGSPRLEVLEKSKASFIEELQRCNDLGIGLYNFHPGSSLGEYSDEQCLSQIANSLNTCHEQTKGFKVVSVIENTAGQGNSVGHKLEHLASIIEKIEDKSRIGICLDTAHLFGAGYDIASEKGWVQFMHDFDEIVGFKYLKAWHLNDSKVPLGSRKDRHESIGKGEIGSDCFERIMNEPLFRGMPLILETPCEDGEWVKKYTEEINLLKSFQRT